MGFGDKNNWIWSKNWENEDQEKPRLLLFRKTFELEAEPKAGMLDISADTRYKLYVNGRLVEIGPCKGDRQVWFYDTVDIKKYLKPGKNVIAVSVLRYSVDPAKGNHSLFRTFTPGLYVKGFVEEEGKKQEILGDESWRCKRNTWVQFVREEEGFAPLMIHETAQGEASIQGWNTCEYEDSNWENAKPYVIFELPPAVSPGNLFPRPIPFLYRKKRNFCGIFNLKKSAFSKEKWQGFLDGNQSLVIPANSEELVEIDAGEEMTGYIYTEFEKGKNARVQLLYAEAYLQEGVEGPGNVPVKGDRLDVENGHLDGYQDVYTVAGFGEENKAERYETYWFRTFRFVQLHIRTGEEPLVLRSLNYEETGYPLEVKTKVETSDESLAQIWEISARTLQRCMHETYEDCPYYEQLQYAMDSRTQILYTYAVSADDRLARKCMDDLCRSQRADGLLNCCYPNCNSNVIPGFSIYYILMVYDHMMYFGDKELVEDHLPCVERILDYFRKNVTEKGYLGQVGTEIGNRFWSFIDWAAEWNPTSGMPPAGLKGPITMESLLYIYGLQHAGKLMEFVGRKEDAQRYEKQANQVQDALRTYCTGADGMLQDGPGIEEYSQHCQVFGVLTDTLDLETGRKNVLRTIEEKGYAQSTVAMSFYLFRALEKTGLYEYSDRYWNIWRRMLKLHCTTCIESDAYARSECHAWGALALYELPSAVLGVRPAAPGYQVVKIAPKPGYLTSASGTVKTPVGEIFVSWKLENGQLQMEYKAPEGVAVKTADGEDFYGAE